MKTIICVVLFIAIASGVPLKHPAAGPVTVPTEPETGKPEVPDAPEPDNTISSPESGSGESDEVASEATTTEPEPVPDKPNVVLAAKEPMFEPEVKLVTEIIVHTTGRATSEAPALEPEPVVDEEPVDKVTAKVAEGDAATPDADPGAVDTSGSEDTPAVDAQVAPNAAHEEPSVKTTRAATEEPIADVEAEAKSDEKDDVAESKQSAEKATVEPSDNSVQTNEEPKVEEPEAPHAAHEKPSVKPTEAAIEEPVADDEAAGKSVKKRDVAAPKPSGGKYPVDAAVDFGSPPTEPKVQEPKATNAAHEVPSAKTTGAATEEPAADVEAEAKSDEKDDVAAPIPSAEKPKEKAKANEDTPVEPKVEEPGAPHAAATTCAPGEPSAAAGEAHSAKPEAKVADGTEATVTVEA